MLEALDAGWVELWYQPKFDTRTLQLSGAEALIRVRHPTWGIVSPAYFLPDAGDSHFRAISDFVIGQAISDWHNFITERRGVEISIKSVDLLSSGPGIGRGSAMPQNARITRRSKGLSSRLMPLMSFITWTWRKPVARQVLLQQHRRLD